MNERGQRAVEAVEAVSELPEPDREAFIESAAAGDSLFLDAATSLIRAHGKAGRFLDKPAVEAFTELWNSRAESRQIGPWKVLRKIGGGGMGTVYLAVRADDEYQREVAIKLLNCGPDPEEMARRFREERQILARLDHPNIARLYDGGTTPGGFPYLVMEYIEGTPLDQHCDRRRLTIGERLELFCAVCAAVHVAHQNLVVHRDLKPSNILVTAKGVPKLLDFGIAKLLGSAGGMELTRTGLRPMTPNYASPEQVLGDPITTAADVYSLGVLLYELLTGRLPHRFERSDSREIERILTRKEPVQPSAAVEMPPDAGGDHRAPEALSRLRGLSVSQLRRRLVGDLDRIVMKALRTEPDCRYVSAEQLSNDVRRHLEGRPVQARPNTLAYRAGKFLRRNRIAVGVAAALFALVSSFSVFSMRQAKDIARERDRAQLEQEKAQRVAGFLVELLQDTDPAEARGRDVTVREALDKGAEEILGRLHDQPEIRAMLLETMGSIYVNLGLYEEATPLLELALETRRQSPETEPASLAATLTRLGDLQKQRGRHEAAEASFQEALALRRASFESHHPAIGESLHHLGALSYVSGDFERAQQHYLEALEIRRREENPSPALAETTNDLALVLMKRGDLVRAEPLFRQALDQARVALGPDHPTVLEIGSNLAALLQEKGDLKGAEALYLATLEVLRRVFEPAHPAIGKTINNLATVRSQLGDHAGAEPLFRETLAIARQAFGEEHQYVALAMSNLGTTLDELGKVQEAELLLRRAIEIVRRTLGPETPRPAFVLVRLARLLMRRGEPGQAEGLLREALERRARGLPPGHPLTAVAESSLGSCLAALGRYEEAEALLEKAHATLVSQLGEEHRDSRASLERLVELYEATGQTARAAQLRPGSK